MEQNDQFVINTKALDEDEYYAQYSSLMPHTYPALLRIGFIICCLLFFLCLFSFPYYFELNKKIKAAQNALQNEEYFSASLQFKKLSKELPDNKCMKLRFAHSLFKSEYMGNHIIALDTLTAMTLDKHEWKELLNYMPIEYAQYFQNVKKDRT